MYGPRGTGFLYIQRYEISKVWPLFAPYSNKPADSIEKFEEVGTVFKALPGAIPEMISFNLEIGQAEKSARLRYLRHRWASKLARHPRVRLLTDIETLPGTCFGAFEVIGMKGEDFTQLLQQDFDIHVKAFEMEEYTSLKGIHVPPGLANTIEEVDRFVGAVATILDRDAPTLEV